MGDDSRQAAPKDQLSPIAVHCAALLCDAMILMPLLPAFLATPLSVWHRYRAGFGSSSEMLRAVGATLAQHYRSGGWRQLRTLLRNKLKATPPLVAQRKPMPLANVVIVFRAELCSDELDQACLGIPCLSAGRIVFLLMARKQPPRLQALAHRLGAEVLMSSLDDAEVVLNSYFTAQAVDLLFLLDSQICLPPRWQEGLWYHRQSTPGDSILVPLANFNWPAVGAFLVEPVAEFSGSALVDILASASVGLAQSTMPCLLADAWPGCLCVPPARMDDVLAWWRQGRLGQSTLPALIASDVLAYLPGVPPYPSTATPSVSPLLEVVAHKIRSNLSQPAAPAGNGLRIGFILPISHIGGGANVIISETAALLAMGERVSLINLSANRGVIEFFYPELSCPIRYINQATDLACLAVDFDVLIATAWITAEWMIRYLPATLPRRAYYIQDFEPYFHEAQSDLYRRALATYQDSAAVCVTKTRWNAEVLRQECGLDAHVLGPSYMQNCFFPGFAAKVPTVLTIAAMVRPSSPRRGPDLTMRVLRTIAKQYPAQVNIALFGCSDQELNDKAYALDFPYRNYGEIDSRKVGDLLRASQIFVDFSVYQAMGLTTLEAMACGLAVLAPQRGGGADFVRHGQNGLLIDTASEAVCLKALQDLVEDSALRQSLAKQAFIDALDFSPERCAQQLLAVLSGRSMAQGTTKAPNCAG